MRRTAVLLAGILTPFLASSFAAAESKVTLEKTHLCCGACVKGAEKAVTSVKGATAACDKDAGTITITAPDDKTAQKAVDALGAAGYHGSGAPMKDDSGATGTVKTATVTGFHNCCKKCTVALNDTIKKVDGAKGSVADKAKTVTLTGDFDDKKLVEELNAAGFHVKVDGK